MSNSSMTEEEKQYVEMQIKYMNDRVNLWNKIEDRNNSVPVGGYEAHNKWSDYDKYLFREINTKNMIALEYGCGPGRNIIKFNDRFKRIDGVDICENALTNARMNLSYEGIDIPNLYKNNGYDIPVENQSYDLVFSVICLQHIAPHSIRFHIMEEIYRVLKDNGYFTFQMGYNGKKIDKWFEYYENPYNVIGTNGKYDVSVLDFSNIEDDLSKIGFVDIVHDIRPTGPRCNHKNWLWVTCKKG